MNPTDPKVSVAAAAAGVAGAVVVLLLNLINREPLNQVALETVLTAVVVAVLAFGAGWLKKTPLDTLLQRAVADPKAVNVKAITSNGGAIMVNAAGGVTHDPAGVNPTSPPPNEPRTSYTEPNDPAHTRLPDERGHINAASILVMFAVAIVVVVVAFLITANV